MGGKVCRFVIDSGSCENVISDEVVRKLNLKAEPHPRRWETGLKIELPEFQGGVTPEEFLDWLTAVEETMDFNEVPGDKRVSLVATRFRGRAAAWWQQLKISRNRGRIRGRILFKQGRMMQTGLRPHGWTGCALVGLKGPKTRTGLIGGIGPISLLARLGNNLFPNYF
jgi:hypothetical protein